VAEPRTLEWAERAAALLYERGARRVWAFGSLGEGHKLDMHSDIDLAVEGMPLWQVESIKSELCDQTPCKVDVIAMEEIDAQLRWFVARGRELPRGVPGVMVNGSRTTLAQKRFGAVVDALREAGSRRVLDLGCGPGWLIELLAREPLIDHVLGVDKDDRALRAARERLRTRLTREQRERVTLLHALFTCRDAEFAGRDAAVAVEVIEHLPPAQLRAFEHVVFGHARPRTVVVTTPNAEYNPLFGLRPGERRHPDHRFEMTRAAFADWGSAVADRYGYEFVGAPVGSQDPDHGAASQLGRFTRCS
jgi:SAM-dependent methyltransferase